MSLYTERHGMRTPIEKTYTISIIAYSLLFDCCLKYSKYLAWKYPQECPDGNGCCGLDRVKFNEAMEYEIPALFRRNGVIDKPKSRHYDFVPDIENEDHFDQYALIDLIEFIAQNLRDILSKSYHSFFRHDDIFFGTSNSVAKEFIDEINSIFEKTGLLYHLTNQLEIERIEEIAVLSSEIERKIANIKEPGLKELLQKAIQKHKSPCPDDQKDAVEKIWDGFERMKTYYKNLDKKASVSKIVCDISNGKGEYEALFSDDFKVLTDIGNKFRIRHHETDKIEISDVRDYDYFFNRCLSIIALVIPYLI